jgi:hypothetical protein
MNKESDFGIGWRRLFLYMHIYHIPIDLEGCLYRQGQRTTNTRPFPKSVMLVITGYLAKMRESLPYGRAYDFNPVTAINTLANPSDLSLTRKAEQASQYKRANSETRSYGDQF